jgi:hypothetical protein
MGSDTPHPALVGMPLDEAARTEFFQWFHLEPTDRPDARTVSLKPGGSDFRELVTVTARTDDINRITAIELVLARSFIEDPRQGMFAADIAKSFLAAALAPPDRAHMQHLIDTIAHGGTYARPILTAMPRDQNLEIERESAPYQVWLGRNPRWRRPFDTVLLRLENVEDGSASSLRISVTDNADPAAQSP